MPLLSQLRTISIPAAIVTRTQLSPPCFRTYGTHSHSKLLRSPAHQSHALPISLQHPLYRLCHPLCERSTQTLASAGQLFSSRSSNMLRVCSF
jgi:hypothetical protein